MSRIPLRPRRPPTVPVSLVYVFTEGSRTEPEYFRALKDNGLLNTGRNIEVKVIPSADGKSAPARLQAVFAAYVDDGTFQPAHNDTAWVVSDVDRWPPQQILDLIQAVEGRGGRVAISNPSFEVWLLLHLSDVDVTQAQTAQQAKAAFAAARPKGGAAFAWLTREHLQRACAQARPYDLYTDAEIPSVPCSRVYRLVEALPLAGGALDGGT